MMAWINQYKKLDYFYLCEEDFEVKPYFKMLNLQQSRLFFKIRCQNTPTIKYNFKNDPKFRAEGWICSDCMMDFCAAKFTSGMISSKVGNKHKMGYLDTQDHVMFQCDANVDLRKNKDLLNNPVECVQFFQQVIQRRNNKPNLA